MRFFTVLLLSSLTFTSAAWGESNAIHALVPALMNIVGGRPAEKGDFRSTVMITLKLPDGTVKTCTGFVVEGCVVTAAHCASLLKGASHEIFVGRSPTDPTSQIAEVKTWGDGTVPEFDVAILRPYHPPEASFGSSRDDIATEDPKPGATMLVAGYGLSETEIGPDGKRRNTGSGNKNWGQVRVTNFSTDGYDTLATGPLIVSERAPQIIAPGDSGGYAVIDGKIHGIATVVKPEFALREGEEAPKEELLVDNITRGYHVSLARPKTRKWLFDALDKMDCKTNTKESLMLATRDLVRDNFSKYLFKNDWKLRGLPGKRVIDSIKNNVKRLMNLPPEEPLFIEPTSYGNYAFEFNYTVGPKNKPEKTGTFTVELDTGKVVISASKKNPVELLPPDFDIDERSPTDKPPIPRDRLTHPIYRVPKGKN